MTNSGQLHNHSSGPKWLKSTFFAANVGLQFGDSEVAGKVSSASYRIVNLDFLRFLFSLICCECCEICGHKLDITEDRMGLALTFSL